MFRFMAFQWNSRHPAQVESAARLQWAAQKIFTDLECVLQGVGIRVYCAGIRAGSSECTRLDQGAGVILGTIFKRLNPTKIGSQHAFFSKSEAGRVVKTSGRDLIESYWGRFVAFICDSTSDKQWIVRSASGELNCFVTQYCGVNIYFSHLDNVLSLDLVKFSVNWDYVSADLCTFMPERPETGLNEVARMQHGECIEWEREHVTRYEYWHPFDIIASGSIEDAHEAAQAVRAAAKSCTYAWASCYRGILELLSGGLDSSIVLGCLKDAPTRPDVVCLNYRHPQDATTDERYFAQLVANQAGAALVEHESTADFDIEGILRFQRSAIPFSNVFELELAPIAYRTAKRFSATAYFSGEGGRGGHPSSLTCGHSKLPRLKRPSAEGSRRHPWPVQGERRPLSCASSDL